MKKLALFMAIPLTGAALLTACGTAAHTDAQDGVILRKMEKDDSIPKGYVMWVKYIKDGTEAVVSYDVKEDYYEKAEIGDSFNQEYAVSKGVTEYEYSW